MKLINEIKARLKIHCITIGVAFTALVMHQNVNANGFCNAKSNILEDNIRKQFKNYPTSVLDEADKIFREIPNMKNAQDTIEKSKAWRQSLGKLVGAYNIDKSKEHTHFFANVSDSDANKAWAYNYQKKLSFQRYNADNIEDNNVEKLDFYIALFKHWERGSEGLGTETIEIQAAIAACKFLIMSVRIAKTGLYADRHEYYSEQYLPEIAYSKKQIEDKFKVVESRHRKTARFYMHHFNPAYSTPVVSYGNTHIARNGHIHKDHDKVLNEYKNCILSTMDNLTLELWKQNARKNSFVKLEQHIHSERRNGAVGGGWKLDPIEGTNQNRYYRFDLGSEPMGLESLVIKFNKTYGNANIRLLSKNTTVGMINAGNAKPDKIWKTEIVGFDASKLTKVTRIELTPISNKSDIEYIYVYGLNLAYKSKITGIKNGKPIDGGINNGEKGTDGYGKYPNEAPINDIKSYVSHDPLVGTRLDLRAPKKLKGSGDYCIRIRRLQGANDGIRNIKVTYRDIKGAVVDEREYRYKLNNSQTHDAEIPKPYWDREVASIDITSSDHPFMYAEIEVYNSDYFPQRYIR